jgi:hypothetical protein
LILLSTKRTPETAAPPQPEPAVLWLTVERVTNPSFMKSPPGNNPASLSVIRVGSITNGCSGSPNTHRAPPFADDSFPESTLRLIDPPSRR